MSVQRIVRTLLLVLVVGRCATAGAVEIAALRQHHPWARFRPGSWKQVRLATETLDAEGKVTTTSIARTRTTLSSVGDDGVTLKVEATIELAGKQIESEPQVVKQGWHGDVADRETTIEDLGEDQLTIAARESPVASSRPSCSRPASGSLPRPGSPTASLPTSCGARARAMIASRAKR